MKRLVLLAALMVTLIVPAAIWAGDKSQLAEKDKKNISILAGIYFPGRQVTFYGTRVYVRDVDGFIVTFRLLPAERKVKDAQARPEYERFAFGFLVQVADCIEHPDKGPLGFGEGVVIDNKGEGK